MLQQDYRQPISISIDRCSVSLFLIKRSRVGVGCHYK